MGTPTKKYELLKKAFAIAKHEKGMLPDMFRETVPGWGFPRLSDCDNADLRAIIGKMKRWYVATGKPTDASQPQLDYLQQLWEVKSDIKTKATLDAYLVSNFDVANARLMQRGKCSAAIQSLKKWN